MLLSLGDPPPDPILRLLVPLARAMFHRVYLDEYRRHAPEIARLSEAFLPVMVAARFNENIAPEREKLLKIVRARWH